FEQQEVRTPNAIAVEVAVFMQRCIEFPLSGLAVLKAGATLVPIDSSFPADRVRAALLDAEVSVILSKVSEARVANLNMRSDVKRHFMSLVSLRTSSTTARPSTPSFLQREHLGMAPGRRAVQFMSVGFDACQKGMWCALSHGATLVLPDPDNPFAAIPSADSLYITPTGLAQVGHPSKYPKLRSVMTAGEACPLDLKETWSRSVQFANSYGPTEVSISSHHIFLTIGANAYPWAQSERFTLAELEQDCFYVNKAELTADRFLPDPFNGDSGARMFRTGDLGTLRPSGVFEVAGRRDDQVKFRGYRVELEEISNAICKFASVQTNVMVAFVCPPAPDWDELRRHLVQILPHYMVPSTFIGMENFLPTNSNGKVDKLKLLELTGEVDDVAILDEPTTTTEKAIAAVWADVLGIPLATACKSAKIPLTVLDLMKAQILSVAAAVADEKDSRTEGKDDRAEWRHIELSPVETSEFRTNASRNTWTLSVDSIVPEHPLELGGDVHNADAKKPVVRPITTPTTSIQIRAKQLDVDVEALVMSCWAMTLIKYMRKSDMVFGLQLGDDFWLGNKYSPNISVPVRVRMDETATLQEFIESTGRKFRDLVRGFRPDGDESGELGAIGEGEQLYSTRLAIICGLEMSRIFADETIPNVTDVGFELMVILSGRTNARCTVQQRRYVRHSSGRDSNQSRANVQDSAGSFGSALVRDCRASCSRTQPSPGGGVRQGLSNLRRARQPRKRVAAELASNGARAGATVALCLPLGLELPVAMLAVQKLGATAVVLGLETAGKEDPHEIVSKASVDILVVASYASAAGSVTVRASISELANSQRHRPTANDISMVLLCGSDANGGFENSSVIHLSEQLGCFEGGADRHFGRTILTAPYSLRLMLPSSQPRMSSSHRRSRTCGLITPRSDGSCRSAWSGKFSSDAFPHVKHSKLVSSGGGLVGTGDHGRLLPSGDFELVARSNGPLNEVGGKLAAVASLPSVTAAAVVVKKPVGLDAAVKLASKEARCWRRPGCAVPAAFVGLDLMPVAWNGETDLAALEALAIPLDEQQQEGNFNSGKRRWSDVLRSSVASITGFAVRNLSSVISPSETTRQSADHMAAFSVRVSPSSDTEDLADELAEGSILDPHVAGGRIVCFHGYGTSAAIMEEQLQAASSLLKSYEFICLQAPFKTLDSRKAEATRLVLSVLSDLGKVDGLLGFSQGAEMVQHLDALAAAGQVPRTWDFSVLISCGRALGGVVSPVNIPEFSARIQSSTAQDWVQTIEHSHGHIIPVTEEFTNQFVRRVVAMSYQF
ncbi:hypothetical protein DFJ73DRAFT_890052, partial [Zopfochytrium polystomum]